MKRDVLVRSEMVGATLELGGRPIELIDYARTGLLAVAVGPRGNGKTNAGLLMAEQLSTQGWVSILLDPESELESLYGNAVESPEQLAQKLSTREDPIVVVCAADATAFIPYGRVILAAAEDHRKPLFVMIDEGQLFSAPRSRQGDIGEAADIINEFAGRGRKRALDLFITALRYTGTLHRTIFGTKNLTLIGCQEDATAWSALAAQFRGTGIDFKDLNALSPGEFFCISRRGTEKVRMPMAKALKAVALSTPAPRKSIPTTFSQWDQAMREIPTRRLQALNQPVIDLMASIVGLTHQQLLAGQAALQGELETRG